MIIKVECPENDINEIPFEMRDDACLTPCPFNKKLERTNNKIYVSSYACEDCNCFKGYSEDKKSILCKCKKNKK